ncbi:MAG: SIMPL domain-containing protein [Chromatiales bacterium]|nr:SIMPL domain-containing protein [Chromatiales bacterium]
MKRLACLLLTVTLLGCQGEEPSDFLLLNLASNGEVKLIPDMASMSATISCTDKVIERSADCTKRAITNLFQLLDKHGIKKEDYHSTRINLEKEHTWRNNSHIFVGYKSSSTISMVFRDLDAMSQVITAALTMKSVELSGLNYSHSQIDEMSQQAYLNALDTSRELAEKMQEKLGGKSLVVMEVNNSGQNFVTRVPAGLMKREMAQGFADTATSPIQINPGELTLAKEVNVLYKVYR